MLLVVLVVCFLASLAVVSGSSAEDDGKYLTIGTKHEEGNLKLELDEAEFVYIPDGQCSGELFNVKHYPCLHINYIVPPLALSVEVLDATKPASIAFHNDFEVVSIYRVPNEGKCSGKALVNIRKVCPPNPDSYPRIPGFLRPVQRGKRDIPAIQPIRL